MMRLWLRFIVLILGYFAFGALPTQAADLGIVPEQVNGEEARSWFAWTLAGGETKRDVLVINNYAEDSFEVVLEALDSVSSRSGNFTLVDSVSQNRDLGRWIDFDQTRVTIAPLTSVRVGFVIRVPQAAGVGEHSGAIVTYAKDPAKSASAQTEEPVVARVYVAVPGAITREVVFTDVTHRVEEGGRLFFSIKAQNRSNIKLEPALDISLRNFFVSATQSEETVGTFLAGDDIVVEKEWARGAPKFGYYTVDVALHTWNTKQILADGTVSTLPDQTYDYHYSFWVIPVLLWRLLFILILSWLSYRIWAYLRDRGNYLTEYVIRTVKKGDTIVKIAEEENVNINRIVRLNALTWPYTVNIKDGLLIPRGRLTFDELCRKRESDPMPRFWVYLFSLKSGLYRPSLNKSGAKDR